MTDTMKRKKMTQAERLVQQQMCMERSLPRSFFSTLWATLVRGGSTKIKMDRGLDRPFPSMQRCDTTLRHPTVSDRWTAVCERLGTSYVCRNQSKGGLALAVNGSCVGSNIFLSRPKIRSEGPQWLFPRAPRHPAGENDLGNL